MEDLGTALETNEVTQTGDGDHDRFTHIVLEGFHLEDAGFVAAANSVVDAMVTTTPVVALCGKAWVPGRDPNRYPLCRTCAEIAIARGWKLPV
jgi:hypothetical protein